MQSISWIAREHRHRQKSGDWLIALGIVAIASAFVSIILGNILFGILIIFAAITLALVSAQPEQERQFSLTDQGVLIENTLYPYPLLRAFWIEESAGEDEQALIIIDVRRILMPHLLLPLPRNLVKEAQALLENFLMEEEIHEPPAQKVLEMFGM